jgi:hypothetical protein
MVEAISLSQQPLFKEIQDREHPTKHYKQHP